MLPHRFPFYNSGQISFMNLTGFPSRKKYNKNKRRKYDKIYFLLHNYHTKTYTEYSFISVSLSENEHTYRHICFFSYSIIQSRIMERFYNDHKDFHRVSFNERHNTVKCVFPLSDNNHRISFNKEIEKRGANAINRFSVG